MGVKIATTGLVIFLFFLFLGVIANSEPRQPRLVAHFGLFVLIGLFMMPLGIIIDIWS